MATFRRPMLIGAAGLAGVLGVVAVALFILVHANVDQARLEAVASQALAMEVRLGGSLRVGFFPGLLVTIADVHVRNGGADVVSADEAVVEIELLPLVRNEVRVARIELTRPKISIERDHAGRFNFESPATTAKTSPAVDLPKVSLSEATFVYADERFGGKFEAEGCRLDARDLRLPAGPRSNLMRDVSLTAELACTSVRRADLMVDDLKLSAVAAHGVFDLTPVTARSFGAQGSGIVRADFASAVPVYHFRYVLPQFPIEEFFKTVTRRTVATGRVDFSADLFSQGDSGKAMRQSLRGEISLRGRNLTLSGGDLDKEFAQFESSQRFSLVDIGAFFFVGPLGLVVTKGLNFATLLQEPSGSSEIKVLVSDWKVERGVARAQDVAMATKANRIALKGGLDFVDNRFDDLTLALVDEKGCAKVHQDVRGTFENPVVEKPGIIESLAGPALRLLKKGSEVLGGGQCVAFYTGSVAAPK